MRTFRVPAMRFFSRFNQKFTFFLFASVRCGTWQHGGETNTKRNSINLFMLGYERFYFISLVILFYLYLFIKKGNAPVLSGTPGI